MPKKFKKNASEFQSNSIVREVTSNYEWRPLIVFQFSEKMSQNRIIGAQNQIPVRVTK